MKLFVRHTAIFSQTIINVLRALKNAIESAISSGNYQKAEELIRQAMNILYNEIPKLPDKILNELTNSNEFRDLLEEMIKLVKDYLGIVLFPYMFRIYLEDSISIILLQVSRVIQISLSDRVDVIKIKVSPQKQ